jgi:hypothetical protein
VELGYNLVEGFSVTGDESLYLMQTLTFLDICLFTSVQFLYQNVVYISCIPLQDINPNMTTLGNLCIPQTVWSVVT